MSLRARVDRAVENAAKLFGDSSPPLDAYGAHPVPSLLTQEVIIIKNAIDHGPPFSLSDLVRGFLLSSITPRGTHPLPACVPRRCG